MDIRVWIWPKLKSIKLAIDALREVAISEHADAYKKGDDVRTAAVDFDEAQRDITHELDWRMRPNMRECSNDSINGNSAPVQTTKVGAPVQTVNFSDRALSIISFGFAIASFVISLWANSDNNKIRDELLRSERESRVLQQQVMDQSALLLREGIRQPGDLTNGPAGNLDYKRKEN